jgi:hypothetical protein
MACCFQVASGELFMKDDITALGPRFVGSGASALLDGVPSQQPGASLFLDYQ